MKFEDLDKHTQNRIRAAVNKGRPAEDIVDSLVSDGYPSGIADAVKQCEAEIRSGEQTHSPTWRDFVATARVLESIPCTQRAYDRDVHVLMTLNNPRIVLFGNLLSHEECDEMIAQSRDRVEPSTVVNRATGGHDLHAARTSYGTAFKRKENDLIRRIEKRISALLDCPESQGEPIQILNYAPGAEYKPHMDFFDPKYPGNKRFLAMGGQRFGTVIMYLNDVELGGSTVFSRIGLDVLPRKGHALFFNYANTKGWLDENTQHGGRPVLEGEKWIATKWLRLEDYTGPQA